MPFGTYFKTGFERGLPSHEAVVKALAPLLQKGRAQQGVWPFVFAMQDPGVLPVHAGRALNSRLRIPGKQRRACIPSASVPAESLLQWASTKTTLLTEAPQVFVAAGVTGGVESPAEGEKWAANLDAINATASAFSSASDIMNENLSKEVLHRLSAPLAPNDANPNLFLHDGAFGSHCGDDVKYSVLTHDASAALYLRHMANPTPQVDPSAFCNLFTIHHVHDYKFMDPRIVEEFNGVSKEDLGITSPYFTLYNLANRTVFVSGDHTRLQEAILTMGGLVQFHVKGNLTMAADAFINKDGKPVIVLGGSDALGSPQLFGAHHHIWSSEGLSRVWNGVTAAGAPEFATDLVTTGKAGATCTRPLPIQMGGSVRPRGSNLRAGQAPDEPERLAVEQGKPWRENGVSCEGATFVFVGEAGGDLSVADAAKAFSKMNAGTPLGYASRKAMEARFEELAKATKDIRFVAVPSGSGASQYL
eukprot:NODE_1735_length_1624_cov_106.359760_g1654_i0.p1 GENE.NODE_1735_length_1624_cov_106.359760_g1654_i0~~NODE_1735_length_1624_cov_106.359760_g1654_i0.p1  ORF type:complete len:492 (-),score=99.17 NODE_1735_length_1624_cov_106.359760_g1654_i0:147-1571(-)